MVLRWSRLALVAFAVLTLALVAACLKHAPLARLDTATPITLVVVADDPDATRTDAALSGLTDELTKRNLVATAAPAAALSSLAASRDSKTRSELLAKALGPGQLFLLVELRAAFFAQMQGAWKWNVDAQVTIARTDDQPHATSVSQRTPVFLESESDGARDAYDAAAATLSDRIGQTLDAHFAGHTGTAIVPATPTPAAAPPASSPAPSPPPASSAPAEPPSSSPQS